MYRRVAVVGVGVIGGSIGLALRQRRLAVEVIGIGRREASLRVARDVGAVDQTTTDLAAGVADAELIVVCTPVRTIVEIVGRVAAACPDGALITDAGSTKAHIVAKVSEQLAAARAACAFVGSHPLAGDHRTGPAFARADLLTQRTVVITPTEQTHPEAVGAIRLFWQGLGAVVREMTPLEHDQALAITSHLPHLVAFALAGSTPESMGPLASSGWRDTTRVASADPELWQQIFATNKDPLLAAVNQFDALLTTLRQAIAADDDRQLLELLQQAKQTRDALGS